MPIDRIQGYEVLMTLFDGESRAAEGFRAVVGEELRSLATE